MLAPLVGLVSSLGKPGSATALSRHEEWLTTYLKFQETDLLKKSLNFTQ